MVTSLWRRGGSTIRFNSGDLSRLLPRQRCACGSWMRKLDYFQGRSDNMVKLRGTNVWPEAGADAIAAAVTTVDVLLHVAGVNTDRVPLNQV